MNVSQAIKTFMSPGSAASKPQSGPSRAALTAHLTLVAEVQGERSTLNARLASLVEDVRKAEILSAEITALRDSIDARLADARYANLPAPDVSAERQQLASLEARFPEIDGLARVAQRLTPRLTADKERTAAKLNDLRGKLPPLLREALVEVMASHAADLAEAERRFFSVRRRVFAAALAVDKIARDHALGQFVSGARYFDLQAPKPDHPAFHPEPLGPERSLELWRLDAKAMDAEADALINALLTSSLEE